MIVDGHLDLAYVAVNGRDLTRPLEDLRAAEPGPDVPALNFATLARAGVGLCFGTLFAQPATAESPWGYEDLAGARAQAERQLEQYLRWQDAGRVRLLATGADVADFVRRFRPDVYAAGESPLGVVLLMEGADPLRDADDLPRWAARGVRAVGPTWVTGSRFAGGDGGGGGLTDRGRELLVAMAELGVALDVSHLAEAAFREALDEGPGALKVLASHSNARALVPGARQLSDEMLAALAARGGVVGAVLFNKFLVPGWDRGDTRPTLARFGAMLEALAEAAGWANVALGSDLDGGFGVNELPSPLQSAADLPRLAEVVPDEYRDGVLGGHWLRWMRANL